MTATPAPDPGHLDDDIRSAIESHLRWDARVSADELTVMVQNGQVTISGSVTSLIARRAAEAAAAAVPGVRSVINQIRVEPPLDAEPPPDEDIRHSAEQVLRWSPALEIGDIEIGVSGGVVVLTGFVDQVWKREHAEELVSQLAGVTGVDNRLTVRPPMRPSDRQIAEDLRAAFDRSIVIDADEVRISVDDGTVTLTGVVPNARSREEAARAAFFTRGVVSVRNEIRVDPDMAVGKLRTGTSHPTGP